MVIGGASMAIASMWASMATLSTPTYLFCILNLVIATIFIASNFKSHNHHPHPHLHPHTPQSRLGRPPSFLERVKSVDLSSFYYNTELSHPHDELRVHEDDPTRYNSPSQLNRVPSLLQRVTSFKLASVLNSDHHLSSFHYNTDLSHDDDQRVVHNESTPYNSPSQLNRAPSFLERVKSFKLASVLNSDHHLSSVHYNTDLSHDDEQRVVHNESTWSNSPSQLNRVPSFLERVRSFKLASVLNSDHHSGDTFPSHDQCSDIGLGPHQDLVNGMSEDSGVTPAKKSSANLVKSSSEKRAAPEIDEDKEDVDRRRPATMKASVVVHDESVDAKADDFIRRFKQQLKLQRIDSLRRFREMMNR